MLGSDSFAELRRQYESRRSRSLAARLRRALQPPLPLVRNPSEPLEFPLGRWNLYIGGGGSRPMGYINIDLFPLAGVDVVADAQRLPFRNDVFQRVECDAVLEHVTNPELVMREIERVLAPGGHAHMVVPFCHPLHEYPKDYRRFTPDALKLMRGSLEVVAEGWRTGPTATLLVFLIEYAKLWVRGPLLRAMVHGVLGWLLFPFRYLDLVLFRSPSQNRLGNHCYLWLRKPAAGDLPDGNPARE